MTTTEARVVACAACGCTAALVAIYADGITDPICCDLPTVVPDASMIPGYVEPPRCPDCGCYPDPHRATCLTCLRGNA